MKFDYLSYKIEDNVATIIIDRPPVNAMNSEAMCELYEILYRLRQTPEVRAVVLTAAGKFFVAGSDVTEFVKMDEETGSSFIDRNDYIRDYLYTFPQPVICALNGTAIGGGLGMALMCDIRITHPDAKFAVGEINMGVLSFPQYLAMRCSNGGARKMVYTGERITAEEALRIGLVDEVVPKEEVYDRALALAKTMAAKSPKALRAAKQCMLIADEPLLQGFQRENAYLCKLWGTKDKTEAVTAFLEKREPKFQNC